MCLTKRTERNQRGTGKPRRDRKIEDHSESKRVVGLKPPAKRQTIGRLDPRVTAGVLLLDLGKSLNCLPYSNLLSSEQVSNRGTIMKVTSSDLTMLEGALMDTLKAHNLHPSMVRSTLLAWQCFHKACEEDRLILNNWYAVYNDDHIETALKRVFRKYI